MYKEGLQEEMFKKMRSYQIGHIILTFISNVLTISLRFWRIVSDNLSVSSWEKIQIFGSLAMSSQDQIHLDKNAQKCTKMHKNRQKCTKVKKTSTPVLSWSLHWLTQTHYARCHSPPSRQELREARSPSFAQGRGSLLPAIALGLSPKFTLLRANWWKYPGNALTHNGVPLERILT